MSGWRVLGDWGSSRLRVWRIREGKAIDRVDGAGIAGLREPPATVLLDALARWREDGDLEQITLCGMAGARGGLREAPYAPCPLTAARWKEDAVQLTLDGIAVGIAAGCSNGVEDVMRGEETQLFGALALLPELGKGRQLVVLPGTHSKRAWLEDGMILSFRTMLTGELFALLQSSSLLPVRDPDSAADDAEGFAAGLAQAQTSPGIVGKLFAARVGQLREGRTSAWARSYLSGLLIAGEIAELRATVTLPQNVMVIGDTALASRYVRAFAAFGIAGATCDGEAAVLAGLELIDAND
jgi:2-dehydro-3-deoxygalactonokinase